MRGTEVCIVDNQGKNTKWHYLFIMFLVVMGASLRIGITLAWQAIRRRCQSGDSPTSPPPPLAWTTVPPHPRIPESVRNSHIMVDKQCQSQTTYTWKATTPRFKPLAVCAHG